MSIQPDIERVRELLDEHQDDEAEELLVSIQHPMTEIWLNHLRAGGRARLQLQNSLEAHAVDPDVRAVADMVAQDDLAAAQQRLQTLEHPMTQIWQRHLAAGGRARLQLQESLAIHADDPRIHTVADLMADNESEQADELLQSMAHPMTEIWRRHLNAGGASRLHSPPVQTDTSSTSSSIGHDPPDDDEMDERMRIAQRLMRAADRGYVEPPAPQYVEVPEPNREVSWAQDQEPAVASVIAPQQPGEDAGVMRSSSMIDFLVTCMRWLWAERTLSAAMLSLALAFIATLILSGTPLGVLFTIIAVPVAIGIFIGRVETRFDAQADVITRQFHVGTQVVSSMTASLHERFRFDGNRPSALHMSPGVAALKLEPRTPVAGNDIDVQAQIIVRTVVLSLWAWDMIEIRRVVVYGPTNVEKKDESRIIVLPAVRPDDVHGAVEQSVVQSILRWQADNRVMRRLRPWYAGPDIETLLAMVLTRPSAIVQLAQQEAVQRGQMQRGLLRNLSFSDRAKPLAQTDAHNLMVLMRTIAALEPDIHQAVITGTALASNTTPAYYLQVSESVG